MAAVNGLTVAAWTAIPEWTSTRTQRLVLRGAVLGSALTGALLLGSQEPAPDPVRDERMAKLSVAMEHPATRVVIIAATLGVAALGNRVEHRLIDAGTAFFEQRGLTKPRTVFAVVFGLAVAGIEIATADDATS